MVRLAQAKMQRDFKEIYDPEHKQDLETAAIAACGIRCIARAAQATQANLRSMSGNASSAAQAAGSGGNINTLGDSAKKAGYIVGDVEGGKFGEHHFWEFWNALQLKDYYDKLKGEAEARADSGHYALGKGLGKLTELQMKVALAANPLGAAYLAQGGDVDIAGKVADSFYRNRDAIDQTVDVAVAAAAVAATVFSGGAAGAVAATALSAATAGATAYKATIGAYEGGLAGAIAGGVTGYLAGAGGIGIAKGLGLNLNLAYSYDEGFSGGVGVGFGKGAFKGASLGINYSEREGFGASVGFQAAKGLGLSLNANASGGYGGGLTIGQNIARGGHGLKLGYQYSRFTGGQTSLALTQGSAATNDAFNYGLTYGPSQGFGVTGGMSWDQGDGFSSTFGLSYNRVSRLRASYSLSRDFSDLGDDLDDGWPGNPVPRNRNGQEIFQGAGYRIGREGENVIGMVAPVDAGDEGPMGANELSQYAEGGALPDGVSTAKEFKHWQAADRAHHILISQNPEKYNNKATWRRIRDSLKPGVNYSDAEIRSLVAAEGGDAFDVNEDKVAVVKAGKWDAQRRHDHYTKLAQARAAQREYNAALATTLQFLPEGGNKAPAFIDSAANGYMNFMRDRFNDVASVADTVSDKLSEFGAVQYMQDKLANVYNGIEEVLVNDFAYSDADNIAERFAKGLIRGGGKSAQFLTEIAMDPAGKLGDVWDFMGNKAITAGQAWWNSDMSMGQTLAYMDRLASQALNKGAEATADYAGRLATGENAALLGMTGVAGAMLGESLNPFHKGVRFIRRMQKIGMPNGMIRGVAHTPRQIGGIAQRLNPFRRVMNDFQQVGGSAFQNAGRVMQPKSIYTDLSSNAHKYLDDLQAQTGRRIFGNQRQLLADNLRTNNYGRKLTAEEQLVHRREFNSARRGLIEAWERNTGQSWPTYTEEVYASTGRRMKSIGDPYDAHHIIESSYGGPAQWWNIHPARFPDQHQGGIHRAGAIVRTLFP